MTRFNRAVFVALTGLVVAAGMQVFVTAPTASAATCRGKECDNVGPQGAGCFEDNRIVASGGGRLVWLQYSPSCHAFWAYAPTNPPCFWKHKIDLEMERWVDWGDHWLFERRLSVIQDCGEADWTNALGARTSAYQFRAILSGYECGGCNQVVYTGWIKGDLTPGQQPGAEIVQSAR